MHVASALFAAKLPSSPGWSGHFFQYCDFKAVVEEGGSVDSTFEGCTFTGCDWYWTLFNVATFVRSKFVGCKFRGCSLAGCILVECEFVDCEFTIDNLGGACSFDDTRAYGCITTNTTGAENLFERAL